MKTCTECKHANWRKTTAGKLHPSGEGKCTFRWELPELPVSMYWIRTPKPSGGMISRRRYMDNHCAYWEPK